MPIKNKMELQTVKGMQDILPEEFFLRKKFLEKAKSVAEFYGFQQIHTPYLEKEELFTAGLGDTTDVVEKQMYSIKTRGDDKLVLRPEGTAPIMRAYIGHGMHTLPQPVMFYYDGFFFRHESPQKGRRREFQQFGLEILGEKDSITDALIIKVSLAILEEMGIGPLKLHVNSIGDSECRKSYQKDLLAYYRKKVNRLCNDCKKRLKVNPLRLLDCKEEKCLEIKREAPQIINYLCENCTAHFKSLLEILDASETSYYLDHYLVRGLDYYSRTVFEISTDIIKNKSPEQPEPPAVTSLALLGGGRYDSLGQILARKDIPAVGCAMGVDRIVDCMQPKIGETPVEKKPPKTFFVQLGQAARDKSINILETLRKAHIPINHSLSKDSLRSQLKVAAKIEAPYALIFGQKEALDDTIIVRNMELSSQEIIPLNQLVDYLKLKLKK